MITFEELKAQLARTGHVELHYSLGRRLSMGLVQMNFSKQRGPKLIATSQAVWADIDDCPEVGWAWSDIRDIHIGKSVLGAVIELTVDADGTPDSRSKLRLPRALGVHSRDLAMWLAAELSARGTPL